MKTYLVTGAAGFIGANFIKYLLYKKYANDDIRVVVLDALTYAGNLGTIKDDIDNRRCFFVKGDIRDRELADRLFSEYDIDYVLVGTRERGSYAVDTEWFNANLRVVYRNAQLTVYKIAK